MFLHRDKWNTRTICGGLWQHKCELKWGQMCKKSRLCDSGHQIKLFLCKCKEWLWAVQLHLAFFFSPLHSAARYSCCRCASLEPQLEPVACSPLQLAVAVMAGTFPHCKYFKLICCPKTHTELPDWLTEKQPIFCVISQGSYCTCCEEGEEAAPSLRHLQND